MDRLKKILKRMGRVIIAFSGGVDSTFLVKIAKDVLGRDNVLAVTAASETFPRSELRDAKKFAGSIGIKHLIIKTRELRNTDFKKNPPQRCYYCKSELFDRIKRIAKGHGFKYIADASNYDDRRDFRPGSRAAKERGIVSPLKEAHLTKDDIRRSSKKLGLATWDKPSYACLASRIPYYDTITRRKLEMIERAEDILRGRFGFSQVRVRCHGEIARIEVKPQEIRKFFKKRVSSEIAKRLQALGFKYVTVDLRGYRTGSMNEGLTRARQETIAF